MGTVVLVSFLFFYFFFFSCLVLSFVAEINELMLAFDEQLLSFHSSNLILDSSLNSLRVSFLSQSITES